MPIYEINGKKPIIEKDTWIAPSAEIIGNVTIGMNCYIGFGAVIRGDFGKISIGDGCLIEEGVIIHGAKKVVIEDNVIVGHMAMLHDTTIRHHSLIGMQSMVCDNSEVHEWSILAERSTVMKKQVIPSKKIYGGSPAEEIGDITQKHIDSITFGLQAYSELTCQYVDNFKKIG